MDSTDALSALAVASGGLIKRLRRPSGKDITQASWEMQLQLCPE